MTTTKPDKLEIIRAKAREAMGLEKEIADLDARRAEKAAALRAIYNDQLPTMFNDAQIDTIGVPPAGNMPGVDFELKPYYSASIAASWPEDRKENAFALLRRCRAEDLIKTEVSAKLPKGDLALAKKLVAAAKKLKIKSVDLKRSVHSSTLSAWLRELYEGGGSLPQVDLEKIGGSVGQVVKQKERKE